MPNIPESEETSVQCYLNPLRFFGIEKAFAPESALSPDVWLSELCGSGRLSSVELLQGRYERLSRHDTALTCVPNDELIRSRLIGPLREAKQAYCLGYFLGCVAICGTVAEMVIVFLFEVNTTMDEAAQKEKFESTFERLSQYNRTRELQRVGLLRQKGVELADSIRDKRNKYLHVLSHDVSSIEKDAERVYKWTLELVNAVIGLRGANSGKVGIPPHLQAYFRNQGSGTGSTE